MAPDGEGMTTPPAAPARLAPFLAQWDYLTDVLFSRLTGLTDEELLWEPAPQVWTVRLVDGRPTPDVESWPPDDQPAPPRTLAWTLGHLGAGATVRADWLVGSHSLKDGDVVWPMTAAESVAFARAGLQAWRDGLAQMTDEDLDTVGRSAYPGGLDTELPLIEIVWWVSKELLFHAGEAWFVRDLYAHRS
jgi:DinB superfamily